MRIVSVDSFESWREIARRLLLQESPPESTRFYDKSEQSTFFSTEDVESELLPNDTILRVPRSFVDAARLVAYHRNPERWNLLYGILWRLVHGEPHLLDIVVDDAVYQLNALKKEVQRAEYTMRAFVRFRRVVNSGVEFFVAWFEPDHPVLRLAAPFFAERFAKMNWSILTPDESVVWDQQSLTFGEGVPARLAPQNDALEELWKTYYASVFNPARVKMQRMVQQMPRRHWNTIPETSLIPQMLMQAPVRVEKMLADSLQQKTARDFLPSIRSLDALRDAASRCTGCDLHHQATQTVFGEGPASARIVLLGEQPGDQEDLQGAPFVGPAGQLLNQILDDVGLDRKTLYVTNAVKHFRFVERGKHRLHKKPSSRQIGACQAWLEAELDVIRPEFLVCLGGTAAQAIFGRPEPLRELRGRFVVTAACQRTLATYHPAAILRVPAGPQQDTLTQQLAADLRLVAQAADVVAS